MDWSNLNIKAKDLLYVISFVITMVISITTLSNKVDNAVQKMNEKIENDKEYNKDNNLWRKSIENSVNANSLQIKLMQQDVEMIKQGYYPNSK